LISIGGVIAPPIFYVASRGMSDVRLIDALGANLVDIVLRLDGKYAIATDTAISSVNVPNGRDPIPDAFFRIKDTGDENDTLKIDVAATANDPSTPDDDVPAYTKTFTVLLAEVGDEAVFAARIISELNADSTFKNTVFLKAGKVKDRRIVHISSSKFSLTGEFFERLNGGDFDITTTGNTDVFEPHNTLVSRTKETSLSRDPSNPHNLGIIGISGTVTQVPGALSDLFIMNAEDGGSADMRVDGSSTPVEFLIPCDADDDVFVKELKFYISCNGLKMSNFACLNSALTNGIKIDIQSDELAFALPLITTTAEFNNKFVFGAGSTFDFFDVSGTDQMQATFLFENPFPIRVCGAFTVDDEVKVTIQDDLDSGLAVFEFISFGFRKEP